MLKKNILIYTHISFINLFLFLPIMGSAHAANPILPIATVTPGAINPNVTQANIHLTICLSGYTKTIRPLSSYTTALKQQQLTGPYSFYNDRLTADFEEDHLISLEIGGSPTDPKNLWPEPYAGTLGARAKDKIENKLHALVCSGQISLRTAQMSISKNWYVTYQKYIGEPVSKNRVTKSPTTKSKTPVSSAGSWPGQATGLCNDGTYSFSASHRGMCSRHGGVRVFRY